LNPGGVLGQEVGWRVNLGRRGTARAVVQRPQRLSSAAEVVAHDVQVNDARVFRPGEGVILRLRCVRERRDRSAAADGCSASHKCAPRVPELWHSVIFIERSLIKYKINRSS